MQLKLLHMLMWVLPPALLAWAIGLWPMYSAGGVQWVTAQTLALAAGLIVMVARVGVMKVVVSRAARDAGVNLALVMGKTFMLAGMVTVAVLLVLGAGVRAAFDLPAAPFFLWMVGLYLVMLAAETWWLSRALKNYRPRADKRMDTSGDG